VPSDHPLLWAVFISGSTAAASMPVLKRLGLAFEITASRADGSTPARVPTLGGPGIVAGFVLGAGLLGMLPLWLLIGPLFLCIAGVVDDARVLTPAQKIAAEVVAAAAMILTGPDFAITGMRSVDAALVGLWLVGTANAFNLIDGLDGLAAGVGIIVGATLSAAAAMHGHIPLSVQAAALASALAAFLVFNFSPASIFMGDSGALPVGLLLGGLALRAAHTATASHLLHTIFPIIVMMLPLLDTVVVIISRIVTGHPISRRSLDHAHDRLLMLGLSARSTAIACWAVELTFACCALMMSLMMTTYVVMLLPAATMLAGVAALFMADLTFDAVAPSRTYGELRGVGRWVLRLVYQWRMADRFLDIATVSAAYFGAYLIRHDFTISEDQFNHIARGLWQVLLVSYLAFVGSGVYRNMWRYMSMSEALRFGKAAALAALMLAGLQLVEKQRIPRSIPLLFAILLVNLLIASRFSFHLLRRALKRLASSSNRVLVVGAGRSRAAREEVVGFLDDDPFKRGKLIHGYRVFGPLESIETTYQRVNFHEVVIASSSIAEEQLNKLRRFARQHNIKLMNFGLNSDTDGDIHLQVEVVKDRLVGRITG
jgi:UDP-GlcNAc:undecaprenyl-phosphate/decaprenyl-phosphate GlcNAc-1-phosphate transferase